MWKIVIPEQKDINDLRCNTLDELCRLAFELLKKYSSLKAYCVTGLGFCVHFARRNGVYMGSA